MDNDEDDYANMPKRPIQLSVTEQEEKIKEMLGYNNECWFKDEEGGNEDGMKQLLGITEEHVYLEEIEKRRRDYNDKLKMLKFKHEKQVEEYERKIAENPKWTELVAR